MDELADFRALLRERLSERGAQARLSEESGIATQILGRWRDGIGRPTDANLKKLAQAPSLGVSYEDLLRMCDYLPGEVSPERADPRLARLLAVVQNGWDRMPEPMRDLAEPVTHALWGGVQPATSGNGRKRASGNDRRALDRRGSTRPEHGADDSLTAHSHSARFPGSAGRLLPAPA